MSWIAAAVVGSAVVGGAVTSRASDRAANAQTRAADAGIDEQRRQFDRVQELLSPYVDAGEQGLMGQMNLAGLGGQEAQQAAIDQIMQGPEFANLTQQGEEAILQNASATGGLRGGDTQAALAQFRPGVLSGLINQQYGRLGGLAGMGQASAAGVGAAGMQTGQNVAGLMQQQGAAQAGGAMAQGQAWGNVLGQVGQLGGAMMTGAIANPFATQGAAQAGAPTTSIRPIARPF
jgi:hypothetical protein